MTRTQLYDAMDKISPRSSEPLRPGTRTGFHSLPLAATAVAAHAFANDMDSPELFESCRLVKIYLLALEGVGHYAFDKDPNDDL